MENNNYEFGEFWWKYFGIDIDALDDEVYMEMMRYLKDIAKYQRNENRNKIIIFQEVK